MRSIAPRLLVIALVLALAVINVVEAQEQARTGRNTQPAMQAIQDDPSLPRVLLIGDSISIGYTLDTRRLLAGKANVHRPLENCAHTEKGLEKLDEWLGSKKWDVIHFNWGLHDLKYVDQKGNMVPPKLIWATTTPVPEGGEGRVEGDAAKYNAIAEKIMRKHRVAINDLYGLVMPRLQELQKPRNVHFEEEGSKLMAERVAASILRALEER
jgi:lysophospholipase L1-like esterase